MEGSKKQEVEMTKSLSKESIVSGQLESARGKVLRQKKRRNKSGKTIQRAAEEVDDKNIGIKTRAKKLNEKEKLNTSIFSCSNMITAITS